MGVFWPFLPHFYKMTQFNPFIFSGTLFHPNRFRLRLFRAFFDAWFTQNKILTELDSAISAVQFSFATIFQYFNCVRFRSFSKLKLCYGVSLQWFVDIFFHFREISKQTLGNIKITALIFSSESVNMLTRGVAAAVRVVRNHCKSTSFVFLLYS